MKTCVVVLLAGLAVGCATSHEVTSPLALEPDRTTTRYEITGVVDKSPRDVPDHFEDTIVGYVKSGLRTAGLLAGTETPATCKVSIAIDNYRMRSSVNRAVFGPLAGRDELRSKVTVTDVTTQGVLGESIVSTYSAIAYGGESDLARLHGAEIVKFLSGQDK